MGGLLLNQVSASLFQAASPSADVTCVSPVQNRHDEFRRITFLLLYPTVYDTATAAVDEDEELAGELVRDAAARGETHCVRQLIHMLLAVRLRRKRSKSASPMCTLL